MQIIYKLKLCMIQYAKSVPILFRTDRNYITTDRQNLNFVGFYFYLFVYQLLAVFIFVLLKTYPLSK